jgi:hypothetical protein
MKAPVFIQVSDEYAIGADSVCWMIKEKREVRGKERWEAIRWYSSLPSTMNGLGDLMVRTSGARSLPELLVAVNNTMSALSQALAPHYSIEVRGVVE